MSLLCLNSRKLTDYFIHSNKDCFNCVVKPTEAIFALFYANKIGSEGLVVASSAKTS